MKTSCSLIAFVVCLPVFAQTLPNGTYTLQNQQSMLVLDDPGWSQTAGTQAIQWGANGGVNQSWVLTYDATQGGYLIANGYATQLFLSDINGKLDLQYQDSPAHQYWALTAVTGGYVIRNVDTGRVMDDPGRSMNAGTGIITWATNGGVNQSWALRPVGGTPPVVDPPPPPVTSASRTLYAVNESGTRGGISVYDIDHAHKLLRTISTVSGVSDVRGIAASAVSGKLYVSYNDASNNGHVFCLNIATDAVVWNKQYSPGVDRLAISPDGQLLYVPTNEEQYDNYINVVDANSGAVVRTVTLPTNRSHDTLYPLSGPIFQETKASDGTGKYLYMIDPQSYAVSKVGPFHDFLGPYAVDYSSRYAVADVNGVLGFQVVDVQSNTVATAKLPYSVANCSLPHGIGWTPDQSEVWQNTTGFDPHIYVWDMTNPMQPVFKQRLNLGNGGSHWLTFDIKGDYAYVAPNKNSGNGTDVVNVATHSVVGKIASSEDMLEVDFDQSGKVSQVGDQYGIGR